MNRILFDATVLVDGNDLIEERRGIYFIAFRLLNEFCDRNDCDLVLFAENFKIAGLKKVNEAIGFRAKLYRNPNWADVFLHKSVVFFRRKRMDNFSIPLLRKFFALWITLLYGISAFVYFFINRICSFDKNVVYFSPRTSAPNFIHSCNEIQKYVVLHDLIPYVLPEYASQRKLGWFGYLIKTLNDLDFYFAISTSTKNDFCNFSKKINPAHVSITPWAADSRFKPYGDVAAKKIKEKFNIPLEKKFVFSLCTLEPRKNLIRTVKTFLVFLKKNNIDDLIFVVGGGEWENFKKVMQKELQDFKLFEEKVWHIGYVKDNDLPLLYSAAQWFVYTSQYEGFGLPPLEAMQCGCPVITSNSTSLPEVVGDAGLLIDWDSDEQHVDAYEKYYFDSNLREINSQKGLERAKQFSWEKTADQMIKIMSEKT